MTFPVFLTASLLLLITPGPTNTLLAAYGARHGLVRSAHLPLAEAAGYIKAMTVYMILANTFELGSAAITTVKLVAAVWLTYSALKLWTMRFDLMSDNGDNSSLRVFLTTIVNPKALFVVMVMLNGQSAAAASRAIAEFAILSTLTGFAWVWIGASMPQGIRIHAYKFASVVLAGFSAMAFYSAISH